MKKATKTFTRLRVLWSRVPAQKQLLYLGLACIAALVTFTAWVWVTRAQASINESVKLFGQGLAEALARGGAEALSNSGDLESLRYYILTQRGKLKTIAYIVFEDNAGNILLDPTSKKDLKEIYPVYKQYKENPENFTVQGIYP